MLRFLGKILVGLIYAAIPIVGWYFLAQSFKRLKSGEIATIQDYVGNVAVIDKPGIYFEPIFGSIFSKTFSITASFIDFGAIKRVFVKANHQGVKMNEQGEYIALTPGYNIIEANELFQEKWLIDSTQEHYLLGNIHHVTIKAGEVGYAIDNDTGAIELLHEGKHALAANKKFGEKSQLKKDIIDFPGLIIVRIREGFLGVKTNKQGVFEVLEPGIHIIDVAKKETFDSVKGIQDIRQDDFVLGNTRYVRILNGELGESYIDGIFNLLKPGLHKLPANHLFVKKVPVNSDVVDLGALKIITVKDGQVAVINTTDGVATKGPGKYEIKQQEGNYFNTILTTSLQGLTLDPLNVICSDQIEMTAKSMVMYTINEPLKTVGLGMNEILSILKDYSDGILRSILSRFNSSDISPPLHEDVTHNSAERADKLKKIHDDFVSSLNEKAENWGLSVTDLQITEILPTDPKYLATLQSIGIQQVEFFAQKNIADSEAEIAKIKATAEKSMVIAAENERNAELIKADTQAQVIKMATDAEALRMTTLAQAEASSIGMISTANNKRIAQLNNAMKHADPIAKQIMLTEAQGKITTEIMKHVKNPVFVQPELGNTTVYSKDAEGGLTLFSTAKGKHQNGNSFATEVMALNLLDNRSK